ncbi:MAG TPA: hypothetical protein ENG52_04010 [Nitrososphaeria archaeon]|nr:hypothetical protein [Nitrososphaeria archaeon]
MDLVSMLLSSSRVNRSQYTLSSKLRRWYTVLKPRLEIATLYELG